MKLIGSQAFGAPSVSQSSELAKLCFDAGCDCVLLSLPTNLSPIMQTAGDCQAYLNSFIDLLRELGTQQFQLRVSERAVKQIGADRFVGFCMEAQLSEIVYVDYQDDYTRQYLRHCGLYLSGNLQFPLTDNELDAGLLHREVVCLQGNLYDEGQWELHDAIGEIRRSFQTGPIYCDVELTTPVQYKVVELAGADGVFLDCSRLASFLPSEDLFSRIRAIKGISGPQPRQRTQPRPDFLCRA